MLFGNAHTWTTSVGGFLLQLDTYIHLMDIITLRVKDYHPLLLMMMVHWVQLHWEAWVTLQEHSLAPAPCLDLLKLFYLPIIGYPPCPAST